MKLISTGLIAKNRKALHDYEVLEQLEAGIVLIGSEVKSLRLGQCNIADSYADIRKDESGNFAPYLINFHINEYKYAKLIKHEPLRIRKLLLNKKEIKKLIGKTAIKGFTLVPLEIYFNPKGLVKIKLAVCKGKSKHDKRESEKNKEWNREQHRQLKSKKNED